jgi:hypothetical protein
MARTIHDTLGVANRAMQADWSDDEISEAIAGEMRRKERPRWYFVSTLAEAHLNLRDSSGVEADVARMRAWGRADAARQADVYTVLALTWSEQWEQALSLASRLLATGKYGGWKEWLAAARFESAPTRSTEAGRTTRRGRHRRAGEPRVHRGVGAADSPPRRGCHSAKRTARARRFRLKRAPLVATFVSYSRQPCASSS